MTEWTDEELARLPVHDGVRLRGLATTRLESFCDASFAFAVTILVISTGGVPGSFPQLLDALRDVPAFAASFAAIAAFWAAHRQWSRRYGLDDRATVVLSLAMVFVMLVYVYPLKMVFSALAAWISGGALPATFRITTRRELSGLFVVYGAGFAAQAGMLALLYRHALGSPQLRLSALERLRTRHMIATHLMMAGTGVVSALYALLVPGRSSAFAGFIYATLAVTMPLLAAQQRRQVGRLR